MFIFNYNVHDVHQFMFRNICYITHVQLVYFNLLLKQKFAPLCVLTFQNPAEAFTSARNFTSPAAHGFHGLNRGELWFLATTPHRDHGFH